MASLILIEQLQIKTLWLQITIVMLSSVLSLLLLQGLFSLIDILAAKTKPLETPVAIVVLIGMTAGSAFVVYSHLQTHPINVKIIDLSAIVAFSIKITPTLVVIFNLLKLFKGIIDWFRRKRKPKHKHKENNG